MADPAGRDTAVLARRLSFRKSLAEAGLPQEFLDQLELKRKQLDESIHKYIAAKERDYRQFERDLKAQHRAQTSANANAAEKQSRSQAVTNAGEAQSRAQAHINTADAQHRAEANTDAAETQQQRRASTEEAQQVKDKSSLSAVNALLRKGARRDSDNNAVSSDPTSPTAMSDVPAIGDRRTSDDRKGFIGVFTPQYLPALDTSEDERARRIARTASVPDMAANDKDKKASGEAMQRTNSDTAVLTQQAHAKRPAHLLSSHRTSSSGSSVEGKLVSAMKSSSEHPRPKRKRVSLAVGDKIVAPSDNVPVMMSNNNTPSHSRTRTTPPSSQGSSPNSESPIQQMSQQYTVTTNLTKSNATNGKTSSGLKALHEQQTANAQSKQPSKLQTSQYPGDDIGEFWHMEEPDEDETEKFPSFDMDDEFEEDIGTGIAGRVSHTPSPKPNEQPAAADDEDELMYNNNIPTQTPTIPEDHEGTDSEHLEFRPGSVAASQQPTVPGFRRPSVVRDPGYTGADYTRAATDADETGIYGSSYARPISKGSFTAGSLGESYMARHAEEMMRTRGARKEGGRA
jgi:hypothetical protein